MKAGVQPNQQSGVKIPKKDEKDEQNKDQRPQAPKTRARASAD
jgi:hypothetical protein